jgi:toxin ParE1/3/4
MPDSYRVKITPTASGELEAIFDYIARDSPQNAARFISRIVDAIDSLDRMPHRYRLARSSDPTFNQIRSMPLRPYLIRYIVDDATHSVVIVSIRHGARRPEP